MTLQRGYAPGSAMYSSVNRAWAALTRRNWGFALATHFMVIRASFNDNWYSLSECI